MRVLLVDQDDKSNSKKKKTIMKKKTGWKKNKNSKDNNFDFVVDSDHSDDDTVSIEKDTKSLVI